jgi:hypothetical protein
MDGSGAPTVYAYGLRNPWRFDFAEDGRLLVGDAGQARWEEINLVGPGDHSGWSLREGPECFGSTASRVRECREACAAGDDLVDPIHAYRHTDGAAVIGGVFGGVGALNGRFVFGDNTSGRLWALELPSGLEAPRGCPLGDRLGATLAPGVVVYALGDFNVAFTAFARDPDGAVLAVSQHGAVFRILTD